MAGFGRQPTLAERLAEQAQLEKIDATAEHAAAMHRILDELKDALEQADPMIKYDTGTLDPNQEIVVRYEPGRYRYAIYTTDTAGTAFIAQWAGKQWKITTTAPGWQALDYPPGTLLYSGDANRHFILIRMSNLKV